MNQALETLVQTLITALGVQQFSTSIKEEHGRVVIEISSPEAPRLIGTKGETLRALNYIAKKIAEKQKTAAKDTHFTVDVNGYVQEKHNLLIKQAHELAGRVRIFGHEIEMSPMNSYERMVVHNALKSIPGIRTESRGEGPTRHIVICPGTGGK